MANQKSTLKELLKTLKYFRESIMGLESRPKRAQTPLFRRAGSEEMDRNI